MVNGGGKVSHSAVRTCQVLGRSPEDAQWCLGQVLDEAALLFFGESQVFWRLSEDQALPSGRSL